LVVLIAIGVGGALSNLAELIQKGSVTDFLLIHNLGDFSAGDLLAMVGFSGALVLSATPDRVGVRKRFIVFTIGVAALSLVSVPMIRPPLNHILPLTFLLASLVWLIGYLWWRIRTGNQLLATLARVVPPDPGPETDRALADLELALRNNLHRDIAASGRALNKLAIAYAKFSRKDDLRRIADQLMRTAEEVDNDAMRARALEYLGFASFLEDDVMHANRLWRESLQLTNQQRNDAHSLRLLANIAGSDAELGRLGDAERTYLSAISLAQRLGSSDAEAELREAMNRVETAQSEHSRMGSGTFGTDGQHPDQPE